MFLYQQELERQKNLLKQQNSGQAPAAGPAPVTASPPAAPAAGPRPANTAEMHLLSANQRAALDMASKSSHGFFIAQGVYLTWQAPGTYSDKFYIHDSYTQLLNRHY